MYDSKDPGIHKEHVTFVGTPSSQEPSLIPIMTDKRSSTISLKITQDGEKSIICRSIDQAVAHVHIFGV